jgi:hypothetical protein
MCLRPGRSKPVSGGSPWHPCTAVLAGTNPGAPVGGQRGGVGGREAHRAEALDKNLSRLIRRHRTVHATPSPRSSVPLRRDGSQLSKTGRWQGAMSGVEALKTCAQEPETVRSYPSGPMNGRPEGGSAAPLGHFLSRRVTGLPHAAFIGNRNALRPLLVRLSRRKVSPQGKCMSGPLMGNHRGLFTARKRPNILQAKDYSRRTSLPCVPLLRFPSL